jgi:aldehyde:ferredoxin oxidoreductase
MSYLYAGSILKINLSSNNIDKEPTSTYTKSFLGGRGINIKLLCDHISKGVDPLGPGNVLIFGVGPLGGTTISSGRTEVTAKSPETGFLGSSNFGGYFASELKFAGYDHIVITGKAKEPIYLWIDNDQVELRDASSIWGKDTYEAPELIQQEVGNPEAKVACIGPAGERLVRFASIQHELGHGAGRTGMGAVMGSKNLKAIAVRGTKGLKLADPTRFIAIATQLKEIVESDPKCMQKALKGGIESYDEWVRKKGMESLAITLSASGEGSKLELPRAHAIYEKFRSRKAGCYGCPIQCMDQYQEDQQKSGVISCALYPDFTYQVRCFDSDTSLECAIKCQKYGMDSMSTGVIISWLMELCENGIITEEDTDGIPMEWGSPEAIRGMVEKIAFRDGVGDILAKGILGAAEEIGHDSITYVNHVKGLPISEHINPRWAPNLIDTCLSLAVSPRGDQMRSIPAWSAMDRLGLGFEEGNEIPGAKELNDPQLYEGVPEMVIHMEDIVTLHDILSTCKWMGMWLYEVFTPQFHAALFSAGSGIETSVETLFEYARKVRTMERAFKIGEGLTDEHDTLPKSFFDNAIKQGPWKGSVLESDKFEIMKRRYYTLRGWTPDSGYPTEDTLKELGLEGLADYLNTQGILSVNN